MDLSVRFFRISLYSCGRALRAAEAARGAKRLVDLLSFVFVPQRAPLAPIWPLKSSHLSNASMYVLLAGF